MSCTRTLLLLRNESYLLTPWKRGNCSEEAKRTHRFSRGAIDNYFLSEKGEPGFEHLVFRDKQNSFHLSEEARNHFYPEARAIFLLPGKGVKLRGMRITFMLSTGAKVVK